MRTAILVDWLNTKRGGGESVLLELADMYPEADIFTLVYNQGHYPELSGRTVKTSFLQQLPAFLKKRSRYLLPLIPRAIERFDLSGYDLVISASSAWVKSAITKPETVHICYCYSPSRMLWDYWPQYVDEQGVGPIRKAAIHLLTSRIRVWDFSTSTRPDYWIPISKTVAERIKKFYRVEPEPVIYPGASLSQFKATDKKEDYYISFGTLAPYKRVDLAIEACNRLGRKLVVAGDGADRKRLEKIAGPTIKFAGLVSDEEKAQLVASAKAFIFPGLEDFGITPIEAMASGTPVIAYGKGGVSESVVDGKTGVFFDHLDSNSLTKTIEKFETMTFDQDTLTGQAKNFSIEKFRSSLFSKIDRLYHQARKNVTAK